MVDPQTLVREQLTHNRWGLLASQGYLLGIDIGGYGLRAAIVDLQQQTYHAVNREPGTNGPEQTVAEVIELARGLLELHNVEPAHIVRVGVGFGGMIDSRSGRVLLQPRKPGWEQYPLKDQIEDTFDVPTLVDNDANLIALAEATFGVARNKQHVFYLHLSSGVGGGMVLNGHLYHGAKTAAGEIGHAPVLLPGATWGDRRLGTLEQHVSIRGLLSRATELGFQTYDLDEIFGDHPVGQQVVEEAVEILALRLAQISALLDPELIVLGGIVTRKGGDSLLRAISERIQYHASPMLSFDVPIVSSMLGYESVVIGGIALGLESLQE